MSISSSGSNGWIQLGKDLAAITAAVGDTKKLEEVTSTVSSQAGLGGQMVIILANLPGKYTMLLELKLIVQLPTEESIIKYPSTTIPLIQSIGPRRTSRS